MHIDVAGQPLSVLSSLKIAADLLDRRATIYSDRTYRSLRYHVRGTFLFHNP